MNVTIVIDGCLSLSRIDTMVWNLRKNYHVFPEFNRHHGLLYGEFELSEPLKIKAIRNYIREHFPYESKYIVEYKLSACCIICGKSVTFDKNGELFSDGTAFHFSCAEIAPEKVEKKRKYLK